MDLKGLSHASTLELAHYMRKKSSLQALPVLALAMNLGTSAEKELKEAGISYIVKKPLRYSTLSAVLLQTIGVQVRAPMKKVNMNAKMLVGRRLLVVIFSVIQGSSALLCLFPTLSQIAIFKNRLWITAYFKAAIELTWNTAPSRLLKADLQPANFEMLWEG